MNERCTVQHSTVLLEATVLYHELPPPFLVVFPVVLYADSSPYTVDSLITHTPFGAHRSRAIRGSPFS